MDCLSARLARKLFSSMIKAENTLSLNSPFGVSYCTNAAFASSFPGNSFPLALAVQYSMP
jgi:hypothetical protein